MLQNSKKHIQNNNYATSNYQDNQEPKQNSDYMENNSESINI